MCFEILKGHKRESRREEEEKEKVVGTKPNNQFTWYYQTVDRINLNTGF
jgi:hypothetical protein